MSHENCNRLPLEICFRIIDMRHSFFLAITVPAPAAAAAPVFSVKVGVSSATVQIGQTESITITVTSNETVSQYTLDSDVVIDGVGVYATSFPNVNFTANVPVTRTFNWTVPANSSPGTYSVVAKVMKGTTQGAGTTYFVVASSSTVPKFSVKIGVSSATVQIGQTESITITVTSNETVSQYTLDSNVVINGVAVYATSFPNVSFTANVPVTKTFKWTVPANSSLGIYTVAAKVIKGTTQGAGWTTFVVASSSPGSGVSPAALFPAMGSETSSVYPWAQYPPGVTYNGGIPARTTQCGPTLTPKGGGNSDYTQIMNAVVACPAGQHVQLGTGVFVLNYNETIEIGNNPVVNNITLRGVGPGPGGAIPNNQSGIPNVSVCGATPCTIIYKNNWAKAIDAIIHINSNASGNQNLGPSINLAANGLQGATSVTLASAPTGSDWAVGRLALIDVRTTDCSTGAPTWPTAGGPELFYTHAFGAFTTNPTSPWSYDFGGRFCRNLLQVVKIAGVSGNVVSLVSPLSITFSVANGAQLTPWNQSTGYGNEVRGIGVEEMYLYGGNNGGGNISMELCDGCWVKHVESHWFNGPSVSMKSCYHCELRDSYLHELSEYKNTTSGGGGYLLAIDKGTANSLVENNIIWNGDKEIVMRASGGGNVIAYNYMDDAFDSGCAVGAGSRSQCRALSRFALRTDRGQLVA